MYTTTLKKGLVHFIVVGETMPDIAAGLLEFSKEWWITGSDVAKYGGTAGLAKHATLGAPEGELEALRTLVQQAMVLGDDGQLRQRMMAMTDKWSEADVMLVFLKALSHYCGEDPYPATP